MKKLIPKKLSFIVLILILPFMYFINRYDKKKERILQS